MSYIEYWDKVLSNIGKIGLLRKWRNIPGLMDIFICNIDLMIWKNTLENKNNIVMYIDK